MKKQKNNKLKEFGIFYNALSVGWHLRKILELEPDLCKGEGNYVRFIAWLERHEIRNVKK